MDILTRLDRYNKMTNKEEIPSLMHDMFVVKPTNTEEEVLDEVRKRGFSVRQCERRTYTMQRGSLSSFYFDLRERMIHFS